MRFGELAEIINERVDDPSKAGVDRYVGLDHLDPECLTIRRWGTPDDVESTKLRFRPGDIIFGKRRAYQRKVAVADFEGICSAHAMVLRAKPASVLPDFLPFFMQSDQFMERAVAISVGSLSPTINWKALASEEFTIPPLEEQRRRVAGLCGARTVVDAHRELEVRAREVFDATLSELYLDTGETRPLSVFCAPPISRGIDQAGPDTPGGIPYIRVSDLTKGEDLTTEGMLRTTPQRAARFASATVREGDIVVALRGVLGLARLVPPELAGANLTQGTIRVSVRPDLSRDYVYFGLQSRTVRTAFRRFANGWKGESLREITLEAVRELPFPWTGPDRQGEIGALARQAAESFRSCVSRRSASERLLIALRESP